MIWILFIILFIIFIIWYGKRPNYYRNIESSDFERFLKGLIEQGTNGSLLFIKHQESYCFIQFAKYVNSDSETIINFGFPDAEWSQKYFKPLLKEFELKSIPFKVRGTEDDPMYVNRFVDVNININNIDNALDKLNTVADIAFKSMGIDYNGKFRIHFEGKLKKEIGRSKI